MSRFDRTYLYSLKEQATRTIAEIEAKRADDDETETCAQAAQLLDHFRRIVNDVDAALEVERADKIERFSRPRTTS